MKGDFTRVTFDPDKHYSGVRMQQGRVQLDADFNEHADIQAHLAGTTRRDTIGLCGGPLGQDPEGTPLAGFMIEDGDELSITRGRYYVDGILCENGVTTPMAKQPDLPVGNLADVVTPPQASMGAGLYLAYLDVWQHHLTTLEDETIREVALGGPDTTTRTQTIWQVRLLRVGDAGDKPPPCATDSPAWRRATAASTGRLSAWAEPEATEIDPCLIPARAGYRGLENHLYRVEVHRIISRNQITFKWSRENGSVVARWDSQDSLEPDKLTVSTAGRDEALGFAPDDWIELTDDGRELRGEPGILVQVIKVDGKVLTINPGPATVKISDFAPTRKVRRWDMPGDTGEITVDLREADSRFELENGVYVAFEAGSYHTGDYWVIPARTATRDIEWPSSGSTPLPRSPHGIRHHYCPLAILGFDGTAWKRVHDCRRLFPPLTEMVRFLFIDGDGQETMPTHPDLPRPLQVGVLNGQTPVTDARVRFRITDGSGGTLKAGTETGSDVTLEFSPGGVYECAWRLAPSPFSQQVEATLLEIDGKPMTDTNGTPFFTPIRFSASLSVAEQVYYDSSQCINPTKPDTVQEALDQLCRNAALYYVSGDGQETMPGGKLPRPLQVRVANGQWPVRKVPVVFSLVKPSDGILTAAGESGQTVTVPTDEDGLASCQWQLDSKNQSQQVEAHLKEAEHQPIRFNASLSAASQVAYDPSNCPVLESANTSTVQQAIDELCKMGGQAPGIHITDVLTVKPRRSVRNDGEVTVAEFAEGLRVECDQEIARGAISPPNCFVTLYLPFPVTPSDRELWGSNLVGFQPLILAGKVRSNRNVITWRPPWYQSDSGDWLSQRLFPVFVKREIGDRVLAHLTVKGNFIWAARDTRWHLDGEALVDPAGRSPVNLLLPSGDGVRGGDFEMWFWLTSGGGPTVAPVDVNTATVAELVALPGVGTGLAGMIVANRPYESDTDLRKKVPGLGARKVANLKGLIAFAR